MSREGREAALEASPRKSGYRRKGSDAGYAPITCMVPEGLDPALSAVRRTRRRKGEMVQWTVVCSGSLDRLAVLFLRLFRSVWKVVRLGHAAAAWYWFWHENTRSRSKAAPLRCRPKIMFSCLFATAIIAFLPGAPAAFLAWYSSP